MTLLTAHERPTARAEAWFEELAKSINLPDARYEAAETSYRSVARWLERAESAFHGVDLNVYTQGSFRLGTAIDPIDRDDYDLDIVCEFSLRKLEQTQEALYDRLGAEIRGYAERYGMDRPEGWERCWTLNYTDSARFHMDILPCVPDGSTQRVLLEQASLSATYAIDAVAITDTQHETFSTLSSRWPVSNPKGYADWFMDRMKTAFDRRREQLRLVEAKASVDDIPAFRVRTPLQSAVQLLKRHRDMHFRDRDPSLRPSSVVLTTLSALAYSQESTVASALLAIVQAIPSRLALRNGRYVLPNPSDPRENFSDSWNEEPARAEAFFEWARVARRDILAAASSQDPARFTESLAGALGRTLVEASVGSGSQSLAKGTWRESRILNARHRQAPPWPVNSDGVVTLAASRSRNGFRRVDIEPNGEDIPKGWGLSFSATTNVPPPFEVFWQVVNTGVAATDADCLRGGFEPSRTNPGRLTHSESTMYPGSHSIECFIVKNRFVAARSGLFPVNIGQSLS
jgi:hypothetical protein